MIKIYFIVVLLTTTIKTNCNANIQNIITENFYVKNLCNQLKNMNQSEVHQLLGEPTSAFFGMNGDIYKLDNGMKISIYYTIENNVEYIKVFNKYEREIISIDIN